MQNLTTSLKLIETDKSCLTTVLVEYLRDRPRTENTPKYQKRFQMSIRQKQTTQKIKRTFGLDREHGHGRSTGNTLVSPIHRCQF